MAFSHPFSFAIVSCVLPWLLLCAVRTKQPVSVRLPLSPPPTTRNRTPQHAAGTPVQLRLAVAYSAHYDVVVTRAVNRTLTALSADLTAAGFSLTPIYSPLPTTFSAPYLADLSAAWANRSVVAVLVFATDGPGLTPALAAAASDLPVLWATGEVGDGYLSRPSYA
ncbi:uncharacterized protein LOC124368545 [Homalodisca vitripennis]|uniref:uncharacterized protein LOC124368545 n=1 Tax=Homalodisca vitripennis TaxID=197043 RepID=UPI001EEB44E1|nr:uncharacterized protein LOC124368545 [Homalodisca vitripennis]